MRFANLSGTRGAGGGRPRRHRPCHRHRAGHQRRAGAATRPCTCDLDHHAGAGRGGGVGPARRLAGARPERARRAGAAPAEGTRRRLELPQPCPRERARAPHRTAPVRQDRQLRVWPVRRRRRAGRTTRDRLRGRGRDRLRADLQAGHRGRCVELPRRRHLRAGHLGPRRAVPPARSSSSRSPRATTPSVPPDRSW